MVKNLEQKQFKAIIEKETDNGFEPVENKLFDNEEKALKWAKKHSKPKDYAYNIQTCWGYEWL